MLPTSRIFDIEEDVIIGVNEERKNYIADKYETEYQLEHSYIDFKWLIIGEKLRAIDFSQEEQEDLPEFNDAWLASLIMENHGNHAYSSLYGLSSIKKIIEYQFEKKTKVIMKALCWFYLIFFVIPYTVTLVDVPQDTVMIVYKICMLP